MKVRDEFVMTWDVAGAGLGVVVKAISSVCALT